MNNFKNNIVNKIKSGEVDMKPRWHFVLKSLLLILGVITVTLLVIYIASFILFVLRQSGVGFVPLYGFRGLSLFVMNSPWLLILSAGAMLVVLQLLVRKYSFSFRQPLVYSLGGMVVLVLLGAYAMSQSQFHAQVQRLSEERRVPVVGSLYRGIEDRRPDNITLGSIVEITDNGFVIESERGETLTVVLTLKTKMPSRGVSAVNQEVLVFGDREQDVITAIGVRPAPSDFRYRKPASLPEPAYIR